MSSPQTVFFSISNFWYKLTQPSGHRFFANIFAKTKTFAKPFLPVHMGPRWNLLSKKNGQKSRDNVPLKFTMRDPDLQCIGIKPVWLIFRTAWSYCTLRYESRVASAMTAMHCMPWYLYCTFTPAGLGTNNCSSATDAMTCVRVRERMWEWFAIFWQCTLYTYITVLYIVYCIGTGCMRKISAPH